MDAISILSLILGMFGLLAYTKVKNLSKQVYLLRSDLKLAAAGKSSDGGSCGCGGNC